MHEEVSERERRVVEVTDRIESLCDELRALRAGPDERERPDDPVLELASEKIVQDVDFLRAVSTDEPLPPMLVTISLTTTDGAERVARLRRDWDHEAKRFHFVDVPPDLRVLSDAIDEAGSFFASHDRRLTVWWNQEPDDPSEWPEAAAECAVLKAPGAPVRPASAPGLDTPPVDTCASDDRPAESRRARQQKAAEIACRIEELSGQLREIRGATPPDERSDRTLEKIADRIDERVDRLKACVEDPREPRLVVTVEVKHHAAEGTVVGRLAREWDPRTETFRFVTVPLALRILVAQIEHQLHEHRGCSGLFEFTWSEMPLCVDDKLGR